MRCLICSSPDRVAIDQLLLAPGSPGSGALMAIAEKFKISRQVLWRHRTRHLGLKVQKRDAKERETVKTLEARLQELSTEASRLQLAVERGMPAAIFDRVMAALELRVKLLQAEMGLRGKPGMVSSRNIDLALRGAAADAAEALPDPEEAARIRKEFAEVCGTEGTR
jgi:hypothetical protein